jgi:hypothetical protein
MMKKITVTEYISYEGEVLSSRRAPASLLAITPLRASLLTRSATYARDRTWTGSVDGSHRRWLKLLNNHLGLHQPRIALRTRCALIQPATVPMEHVLP